MWGVGDDDCFADPHKGRILAAAAIIIDIWWALLLFILLDEIDVNWECAFGGGGDEFGDIVCTPLAGKPEDG